MIVAANLWLGLSDDFWGSMFGTVISGLVAIFVMGMEFHNQRIQKAKEANDNFKKAFEVIKTLSKSFLESYDELNKSINNPDGTKKLSIVIETSVIDECRTRFDTINDDYIPACIYKEFLEIKSQMKETCNLYRSYGNSIQLLNADDSLSVIDENDNLKEKLVEDFQTKKQGFLNYFNRIENYYKSI